MVRHGSGYRAGMGAVALALLMPLAASWTHRARPGKKSAPVTTAERASPVSSNDRFNVATPGARLPFVRSADR